jgi:hypothetical protein
MTTGPQLTIGPADNAVQSGQIGRTRVLLDVHDGEGRESSRAWRAPPGF